MRPLELRAFIGRRLRLLPSPHPPEDCILWTPRLWGSGSFRVCGRWRRQVCRHRDLRCRKLYLKVQVILYPLARPFSMGTAADDMRLGASDMFASQTRYALWGARYVCFANAICALRRAICARGGFFMPYQSNQVFSRHKYHELRIRARKILRPLLEQALSYPRRGHPLRPRRRKSLNSLIPKSQESKG